MTEQQLRPDPLAFLGEELDDLRRRHLYRPLRVMSSAQGPIVSVDEHYRTHVKPEDVAQIVQELRDGA